MSTKYILIGGYLSKAPNNAGDFFNELGKGFEHLPEVKVLDCLFAEPQEGWQAKFEQDLIRFSNRKVNFKLVMALPENFTEQVKLSNIIFFRGGETLRLLDTLSKQSDWVKYIDGKTVVGTSAGADFLSKYSYNLDTKQVNDCLGLLPIKFISHWRSDYNTPNINWDKALADLKSYKEDLPVYALKEGEYIVMQS